MAPLDAEAVVGAVAKATRQLPGRFWREIHVIGDILRRAKIDLEQGATCLCPACSSPITTFAVVLDVLWPCLWTASSNLSCHLDPPSAILYFLRLHATQTMAAHQALKSRRISRWDLSISPRQLDTESLQAYGLPRSSRYANSPTFNHDSDSI